jgi:hypothetical protein
MASGMNCGHPKAARAIRTLSDGSMVTECWACEVEYPKKRRPVKVAAILPDVLASIVRPKG